MTAPRLPDDMNAALEAAVIDHLDRCGPGKTIDPTTIARAVGGPHPDGWGPLMQPLRQLLLRLAGDGRLLLYRKGKPIAPEELRGIYRVGPPNGELA